MYFDCVKTGRNRWWRWVLGLILLVAGILLGNVPGILLGRFALSPLPDADLSDLGSGSIIDNLALLSQLQVFGLGYGSHLILFGFPFLFLLLALWFVNRVLHKRSFKSLLTGATKFRWSRVGVGLLVWGGVNMGLVLIGSSALEFNYDPYIFWSYAAFSLLIFPVQTLAEEAAFRGYLMQLSVCIFRRPIFGLLITSALFAAMHFANISDEQDLMQFMAIYFILAGFMAALVIFDGGLELVWGVHLAQNLMAALVISSEEANVLGTRPLFTAPSGQDEITESVIALLVISTIVLAVFWWIYRFDHRALWRKV